MPRPFPDFIVDLDEKNESLLIHDIARLHKKNFDRRARSMGLPRAQWLAVGALRRHPGINQAQLADMLDVEPITVTRILDRLEKAGWIERRMDASDRRANRLYLTDRMNDTMARIRALALDTRREIFSGIDEQDHEALLRILKHVKRNLCEALKAES